MDKKQDEKEEKKMEQKTDKKLSDSAKITLRNLLLLLCTAVLVEICFFNFRSIQSLFYEEHSWTEYDHSIEGANVYDDGLIAITDETASININNLPLDVKNIRLDLETVDSIELYYARNGICNVDYYVTDEGSEQIHYLAHRDILHDNITSQYQWLQAFGRIKNVYIDISMPAGHLFRIHDITFNAKKPVDFSIIRFFVIWLVLLLGYGFRRGSVWWQKDCIKFDTCEKMVITAIFLIFFGISWHLMISNQLVAYDSYTPYQELAWALDAGQVSLLEKPSQELMLMEDPFDAKTREINNIECKFDFVYYEGNYYVYHGILPCILFYLPLYHLTGLNMPNSIPVFICCLFFGMGFCAFMRQIIIRYFPKTSLAIFIMLTLTGLFGCQLPLFITQPDSYILPIICAAALVVWGLYFWISAKKIGQSGYSKGRIMAGSLCMALVAAARPTLLLYSVLAFAIFGRAWLTDKEGYDKKSRITMMILFALPYVAVAIPVMYYNAIRFGSPFEFGQNYNLSSYNVGYVRFSLDRIYYSIREYIFRIPDFYDFFPFIKNLEGFWKVDGHCATYIEGFQAGLIPFNLFLLAGVVIVEKRKELQKRGLYAFCVCLSLTGILLMVLDAVLVGAIIYRYLADFSFALFATAWVGIFWMQEHYVGKDSYRGFQKILLTVVFLSVAMNAIFLFAVTKFPMSCGNTQLYYDILYGFNFW
ncbi:MAG: hypothetical protein K2K20_07540 [Lachnospiraceae bacterium]|nr:hypothetical protein [Lachnospiraceae bacterium]